MGNLKQQLDAYNARLKQHGHTLITLECPHCQCLIETQAAPAGEKWDSLATCPSCERIYMKLTDGSKAYGRK